VLLIGQASENIGWQVTAVDGKSGQPWQAWQFDPGGCAIMVVLMKRETVCSFAGCLPDP
jgi:hypothetical protein